MWGGAQTKQGSSVGTGRSLFVFCGTATGRRPLRTPCKLRGLTLDGAFAWAVLAYDFCPSGLKEFLNYFPTKDFLHSLGYPFCGVSIPIPDFFGSSFCGDGLDGKSPYSGWFDQVRHVFRQSLRSFRGLS